MMDVEKQVPIRQSLCSSLRRDGHWKCFCLSVLIASCLGAITWCRLANFKKTVFPYMDASSVSTSDSLGPCKDGYVYIPVAFVLMLYLVYLVECWHSHTRMELKYKVDIPTVYSSIEQMNNALPVIWWKATCYHYVRRTRQVMRYRNGDAFSSTQVYYERIDSRTAGAAFNFTHCGVKDISRPLSGLERYAAIKIKVSKGFSFSNLDTEYEFEEQRAQFFQEYETKDDYMEGREGMDLMNVNFKEYMIAFADPNNLPWYVSHVVYWVMSFVLLSWPLRTIIEYKTAHLHYHIHKLFGSNYVENENGSNLMSRVNTMNSIDLEMSIRNNNVVVPSYSEAMLADAYELTAIRDYGAIKSSSKIPRSLTNITLAGRTNTNAVRRSIIPAVTMNKVKRFKSCSAFGEQPSPGASSSSSSTIRNQINNLLRDRNRLNRKRTNMSSVSIAAMTFNNAPSARSPDETPMIPSFSSHSIMSSSRHSMLSSSSASRGLPTNLPHFDPSRSLRRSVQDVSRRTTNTPNSNSVHPPFLDHASRAKSVPESSAGPSDCSSVSESGNDCNPSTTPPQPSPPVYEDAVRGYRMAGESSSILQAAVSPEADIGLTLEGVKALSSAGDSLTRSRQPRDEKQNTNTAPRPRRIDCEIDINAANEPSADLFSAGSNQTHSFHFAKQGASFKNIPTFRPLPKVNPCTTKEPEDSDKECLHRSFSELECSGIGTERNPYVSDTRMFRCGSISEEDIPSSLTDGPAATRTESNERFTDREEGQSANATENDSNSGVETSV